MGNDSTTNSWPFPPQTKEVQLDEKWSFVQKKEAHCDPDDPADVLCGDNWEHTAVDPESRLLLSLVPGKRTATNCEKLVEDVKQRTGGRADILLTSDEHAPYRTAIEKSYALDVPQAKSPGPGRPPKPKRVMPETLCYGTVNKSRENGVVVKVIRTLVFGSLAFLDLYLSRSRVSRQLNTSFVERNNATDRNQNGRKVRKAITFSKNWDVHNAMSYFVGFSYNFCWPVRSLQVKYEGGRRHDRTPAMAAGLADHVWTIEEWLTLPGKPG